MKTFIMMAVAVLCASCTAKSSAPVSSGSELGFAVHLFQNVLNHSAADDNVSVSPFSAGVALSMLEEGAMGETKVEIDNALNGCLFKGIDLGSTDSAKVLSANSIWLDDDFAVRNHYVSLMQNDYDALATTLNFSDPATVKAINNWCSEHTEGLIDDLLKELPQGMKMVIANALYFNAAWMDPFEPKATANAEFHGSKGDKDIPFMAKKDFFDYAEFQGNQLISLPYKDGRYSMYVLLPSSSLKLSEASGYITEQGIREAMKSMSRTQVSLRLPKFRLESEMSLVEPLQAMGMRSAFTGAADLSGIAKGPLSVSDVLQKTVVDVDERGTEAAAVTAVMVKMTSVRPDFKVMNINRPFFYMIADMQSERVLFAGRVMNL